MTPPALQITHWLTGHLAALLEVPEEDIDCALPLDALGVTSMEEVTITADLEARFGVRLPVAEMRRHPTVEALASHITALHSTPCAEPASR